MARILAAVIQEGQGIADVFRDCMTADGAGLGLCTVVVIRPVGRIGAIHGAAVFVTAVDALERVRAVVVISHCARIAMRKLLDRHRLCLNRKGCVFERRACIDRLTGRKAGCVCCDACRADRLGFHMMLIVAANTRRCHAAVIRSPDIGRCAVGVADRRDVDILRLCGKRRIRKRRRIGADALSFARCGSCHSVACLHRFGDLMVRVVCADLRAGHGAVIRSPGVGCRTVGMTARRKDLRLRSGIRIVILAGEGRGIHRLTVMFTVGGCRCGCHGHIKILCMFCVTFAGHSRIFTGVTVPMEYRVRVIPIMTECVAGRERMRVVMLNSAAVDAAIVVCCGRITIRLTLQRCILLDFIGKGVRRGLFVSANRAGMLVFGCVLIRPIAERAAHRTVLLCG